MHRGIVALVQQHFEGPGSLTSAAVAALARLQTFRGVADYDARARLPLPRATEEVRAARGFVDESRFLLRAGRWID